MTAGITRVFVPSIYGEYDYGTIYYAGQWVNLFPPPPGYPVPVQWPAQTPPPPAQQIPAGYSILPFVGQAIDYETIMLTWQHPVNANSVIDFRLLRSRYGFPVDENDGTIILDSDDGGFPATQYFDSEIIPGQMHYYGIYMLIQLSGGVQTWYRAGFYAVLAINNATSTDWLLSRIPEYYTDIDPSNEITSSDAFANSYLDQFMAIFGWGEDYLKTQLDIIANVNNPQKIPVNYLASLAATIGFPFYGEITAGITRNAMSNNAALIKQRGTLQGIEAMITQLTSWGADVRVGKNMMLEDDQSDFLDPVYPTWSSLVSYDTAEYVTYQGFTYQSIANNNLNHPPTNISPFIVATGNSASGASSYAYTVATSSVGGNMVVAVTTTLAATTVTSVTDSKANVYTLIGSNATNASTTYVFQCQSSTVLVAALDTITVHLSTSTVGVNMMAVNAPSSALKDISVTSANASTTSASVTTGALAVQGEQVMAFLHIGAAAGSPAFSTVNVTPFTELLGNGAGFLLSGYVNNTVPVAGTTIAASWTTNAPYTMVTVSFEPLNWAIVYYQGDTSVLSNPTTGWLNTWEPLIDGVNALGHPTAGAFTELKGIFDPITLDYIINGLGITNNSGSTSNVELRSVSRTPQDITNNATWPNTGQVIGDGIPVPYTTPTQVWNTNVQYVPNTIVTFNNLPFRARISNAGVAPPLNGVATNEWQPIGYDQRVAMMLSGYTSQPFTLNQAEQFAVQPYVVWFDETGTFISQITPRTNLTGGAPAAITFDSFALPSTWGTSLASTTPDIGTFTWVQETGTFQVNGFSNGTVIPTTAAQTMAIMNYGSATAFVGVTLTELPNVSNFAGLVLRYSSITSYIRVDQQQILTVNGTALTVLATHSTAARNGDRLTASCNGNTITVFLNGVQVSSATTAFNNTQTNFGITVDTTTATIIGRNPKPHFQRVFQRDKRSRSRVYAQGLNRKLRMFP